MKNKLRLKKGFTIIELIVVVAILGILVLLAGPRLSGYVEKAELTRIKHDVKVMEQKIGEELINKDGDFKSWEDNSKDLNQLIEENKLLEKEGPVVANDGEPIDGSYKVVPEKHKGKINTKLKGTFYANSGGKVYYEHDKPLSGIPSEPEKAPVCSNEEIQDLIDNDFIPVATAEELNNVRNATLETYGKGTEWEGLYTGGLDKKYVQVAYLDLSEEGWTPIGSDSSSFTGSFNGSGCSITGLTIDKPETNYIGLFGHTEGATIENVALENVDITGGSRTGGLVGYATGSTSITTKITNSYATGKVTGAGYTGGLVGHVQYVTITKSYATGSVTGGNYVGGLVGMANGSAIIENSYATGSVTGSSERIGGLVGEAVSSTITNSYATGQVTGTKYVGGLVGQAWGESTITNSYWDTETTGQAKSAGNEGATGKSTEEMKKQTTYSDWDFVNVWKIDEGSYPTLR